MTRVQYPKCAYGPYRLFNPIKNGVYILVEVSIEFQCIKKTSIYRIIGNFPPKFRRRTRKTDDLCTWSLRSFSQSPRATSVRHHSLTSFGTSLNRRGFPLSKFKGHPRRLTLRIGGNRRLCQFLVYCGGNLGGNCR